MSETATGQDAQPAAAPRTPEQEQAAAGANIPGAYEMPLEDINPINAHLYKDHTWPAYFERLRAEDPVHFNEIESAGRYWSVTKYDDIKAVSSDWQTFSSAHGITLGFRVGAEVPPMLRPGGSPPFISQDPPRQIEQRKTVQPAVAPRNLVKLEPLIRERTCRVLDAA